VGCVAADAHQHACTWTERQRHAAAAQRLRQLTQLPPPPPCVHACERAAAGAGMCVQWQRPCVSAVSVPRVCSGDGCMLVCRGSDGACARSGGDCVRGDTEDVKGACTPAPPDAPTSGQFESVPPSAGLRAVMPHLLARNGVHTAATSSSIQCLRHDIEQPGHDLKPHCSPLSPCVRPTRRRHRSGHFKFNVVPAWTRI
jgi:hypothetical protein